MTKQEEENERTSLLSRNDDDDDILDERFYYSFDLQAYKNSQVNFKGVFALNKERSRSETLPNCRPDDEDEQTFRRGLSSRKGSSARKRLTPRGSFVAAHAYASFRGIHRRESVLETGPSNDPIEPTPTSAPKGPGRMIKSKTDFVILIVLCLVEFHGFFSFSMIAPFFPLVAEKKVVSSTVVGMVLSSHPLVVFLLSPFIGKWLADPRRTKPFILGGTLLIALGNMVFAFVYLIKNREGFVALCFLARVIIALGTAIANTASLAVLTEKFNAHLSAVFGLTELFVGMGFMMGPSVGSVLFSAGGFWLPFVTVGGLNIINFAFIWFFVPANQQPSPQLKPKEVEVTPEAEKPVRQVTISRSLKIPAVWITCLTIHTIGFFITYIQPIFTHHLKDITNGHITMQRIGLVFFLAPGVYACIAPVLGIYIDKLGLNPRNLIILGHFLVGGSYIFMGPSPIFTFAHKSLTITSVAYAFMGVGQCPIMVPVLADLQESIVNAGYPNNFDTSSIVSALFTSSINLGQLTGPFLAGLLYDHGMNFQWSSSLCAFFLFTEGFVTLFFTMWERKNCNIFAPYRKEDVSNGHVVSYDGKETTLSTNGAASNASYQKDEVADVEAGTPHAAE